MSRYHTASAIAAQRPYWHGSSGENTRAIAAAGFVEPGVPEGDKSRGFQRPMAGRSYATTDLGYALMYAVGAAMVGRDLPEGERFEGEGGVVSLEGEGAALPDEDWVGELMAECESWLRKQRGDLNAVGDGPPAWKDDLYRRIRSRCSKVAGQIDRKPTWKLSEMATQSMLGKVVNRWLLKVMPGDVLGDELVRRSPHHSFPGRMRVTGAWVFDKREVNPQLKNDGSNFMELATEIPVAGV